MKTLYFDIDGTLLTGGRTEAKPELAEGAFERAVKEAGVEELFCVGSFAGIACGTKAAHPEFDGAAALLTVCGGAFTDVDWLRRVTSLIPHPRSRAESIDLDADWWYVDDLARWYMEAAGLLSVFEAELGRRVCVPDPEGDGEDVLAWLEDVVGCSRGTPEWGQ